MAGRTQQSVTPPEDLWHYVPLNEFTKPQASTRETVRDPRDAGSPCWWSPS